MAEPVRAAVTEVATRRTLFGRPLETVLVVAEKTLWGAGLLAVAGALLALRAMQATHPLQGLFQVELREDPHDPVATFLIGLVPSLSLTAELLLGLVALTFALIQAAQVWALWRLGSGRIRTDRGPRSGGSADPPLRPAPRTASSEPPDRPA